MHFNRAIHLLIVFALLFSQLVSATHVVSHLHSTESQQSHFWHSYSFAETPELTHYSLELNDEGKTDASCVIFHVYSASQCLATSAILLQFVQNHFVVEPPPLLPMALPTRAHGPFFIRGPPVFS